MTLLLLLACSKPQPPVPARGVNAMDTADFGEEEEVVETASAPRIRTVTVSGAETAGEPALVQVDASDPEGGRLRITYIWLVNGSRVSGESSNKLAPTHFKKGDSIVCEVTASNGREKTRQRSNAKTVGNSPPVIDVSRMRMDSLDGLQVLASDPDGDSLSYRLTDGPPGMSIDAKGRLHFAGSKDQTEGGVYRPRILVSDSFGEEVAWEFEVNLTAGKGDETVRKRGQMEIPGG